MDFSLEYTKEQEEFANEVRKWLDENVPKDLTNPRDPYKMSYEQWQKRREIGRKLGEKGWLNPEYPREHGGGGLDADHCFVLHEELGKRGLGFPPYYDSGERRAVPPLMALGTEEQKRRFLPLILKGEVVTWQLFTEPEAGTDEANQQTNALRSVRDKDHFIINGQKIFVGGIYAPPDQFVMLTRSDLKAPRHENLSMFLVPANLPGITIQPLGLFTSVSFRGASGPTPTSGDGDKHSVFFDDVRVHESYLIGREGDGWKAANATLSVEHGDRSGDVGVRVEIARNVAVEKLLEQCRHNPNIVKRLRENPQLLESLVDIYIDAQIERLFSMRNIWLLISGRRVPYAGPQLIIHEKMFSTSFISDVAKVLGPYTLTDDAERGLDENIFEVIQRGGVCIAPGGTPEALKITISRALRIGR